LDHLGPLALCVADARLLLEALTARTCALPTFATERVRIGVPRSLVAAASPDVQAVFEAAVRDFERLGATIRFIDLPNLERAHQSWLVILLAESAAYHRSNLEQHAAQIAPDVRLFLLAGTLIEAAQYLDAQRFRRQWRDEILEAFADIDIMMNPTLPTAVPQRDAEHVHAAQGPMSVRDAMVFYQWPANLLGWPSISVPSAQYLDGLPASMMLTGKPYDEGGLLAVAQAFEHLQQAV
jgi:aspartyl-tRNA(Asn)/glutamyl-tRNA(Gln) amidotransferase subunit A